MSISLVYLLPSLLILAVISWHKTKYGLFLILALLPAFLIRTKIFFIPSTWLELAIYTVFGVWLAKYFIQTQKHKNTKTQKHGVIETLKCKNIKAKFFDIFNPYCWPILLFLLAAVVSTFVARDLRLAAGMLKAYFFDPLLFLIVFISHGRNLTTEYNLNSNRHLPLQRGGREGFKKDLNQPPPTPSLAMRGENLTKFNKKETKINYCRQSIYALTVGAVVISLYGLYEYIIGFGLQIAGRLDSIFVSPNYLGLYLAPICLLIFGLIIYDRASQASEKIFLSASLIILLVSIYLTESYSSWLALIVGLVFLWFYLPKRRLKFILLIVGLIVLCPLMIYQAGTSRFRHYDAFWQISSKDTRMLIWQAALSTGINQPILGAGLGGFRFAYQDYIKTLPKLPPEREAPFPHNLYLTLWLETGLLGLVSFLWLMIIFFSQLFKKEQNHAPNYLNIIIAAGLLAILVHGLTDTPYFKNDLALLFWFLICLKLSSEQNNTLANCEKIR